MDVVNSFKELFESIPDYRKVVLLIFSIQKYKHFFTRDWF